jgi:hypothetical protein
MLEGKFEGACGKHRVRGGCSAVCDSVVRSAGARWVVVLLGGWWVVGGWTTEQGVRRPVHPPTHAPAPLISLTNISW